MFIKSLLFSDCQNVIKVQYRNLLKTQKSQFVLLRDCCYISDSQGWGYGGLEELLYFYVQVPS